MSRNKVFLLLTITLFIGLLLPSLVQEGMFFDGVTYSAISKNLANGIGSFWVPQYTKTLYPQFFEHPPLVFIIQSIFFKFLGNTFLTERIFCLITAVFSAVGIAKIWQLLIPNPEHRKYFWLPVLLWLLVPIVPWSYKNNMLENTMGVFTIFSIFFMLKALLQEKLSYIFLSGILVMLAFLSKGPVGLFPIAVPVIYGIVYGKRKQGLIYFVYLILFLALCSLIIAKVLPDLKQNIISYFNQQLFPALNNKREITTNNRFKIILDLIFDLSIPIILSTVFIIKYHKKNGDLKILKNKHLILCLLIGICASIPLIISLKQRKFYLIPSIPFYVISFGFIIVQEIDSIFSKISAKSLKWTSYISYALFITVLLASFLNFGKYSRNKIQIKDISAISTMIPEGTIISTTQEMCNDWVSIAYLSRIGNLSLDYSKNYEYFVVKKGFDTSKLSEYEKTDLKISKYILLKKKD